MSRTRTEAIRSTLLGKREGDIRCPRQMGLGLDFGSDDPWAVMNELLRARGMSSPEELRAVVEVPGPMLCCADTRVRRLRVAGANPDRVLRQALLLGLCTAVFFDPARPVIWTRASLTRKLSLFETAGFYA